MTIQKENKYLFCGWTGKRTYFSHISQEVFMVKEQHERRYNKNG